MKLKSLVEDYGRSGNPEEEKILMSLQAAVKKHMDALAAYYGDREHAKAIVRKTLAGAYLGEGLTESVRSHEFHSSGQAYNACQTNDDIKNGDLLIIDNEEVIGLADTWPVAVTEKFGELHTMKPGRPMSGHFPKEAVDAAVAEANKRGWPVSKEAR